MLILLLCGETSPLTAQTAQLVLSDG